MKAYFAAWVSDTIIKAKFIYNGSKVLGISLNFSPSLSVKIKSSGPAA